MGAKSDGDDKMSPENLWILFACVSMGMFAYAFLKPMCAGCCTFPKKKKKTEPQQAEQPAEPQFKTIKIHPERAKFRLFPPGEAYYLGGPKRPTQAPKKKKKKKKILNEKWKACVQSIVINNAIRDLAISAQNRLTPDNQMEGLEHNNIKDPGVFSGLSTTANASMKLNGGPMNNFSKIVQYAMLHNKREIEKRDIEAPPAVEVQPSAGPEMVGEAVEIKDETNNEVKFKQIQQDTTTAEATTEDQRESSSHRKERSIIQVIPTVQK